MGWTTFWPIFSQNRPGANRNLHTATSPALQEKIKERKKKKENIFCFQNALGRLLVAL
jgi:hypothetical protein